MLEVVLIDRKRRGWEWQVRGPTGAVLMSGREKTRREAKYKGDRVLFQLLTTIPKLADL
jgi:hypothetical protein